MFTIACIADQTKPWYSPSANQRPLACSAPSVLPRVFIIGSKLALAYGCSFVHRDWTSGSRGTMGHFPFTKNFGKLLLGISVWEKCVPFALSLSVASLNDQIDAL